MYLKRFCSRPGMVYRYDLLVPNEKVPVWSERLLNRVASHEHLYTSLDGQAEVDEHEKWFNEEFESPAEDAIERAVTGGRLSKEHWRRLVYFLAAQDVRTPARLQERLAHWNKQLPEMINETLQESVSELLQAKKEGRSPKRGPEGITKGFPMRVRIEPSDDPGYAQLRLESVVGRGMWLWSQRHLLTGIVDRLIEHRWTVLVAPDDVAWFTTDDPVIRLNYYSKESYTFEGGWGSRGTEIFIPLDPRHMLYTSIGNPRKLRGTEITGAVAHEFRKFFAEHAHRYIFSSQREASVGSMRPRHVSLEDFLQEKKQWSQWRADQSEAEIELSR